MLMIFCLAGPVAVSTWPHWLSRSDASLATELTLLQASEARWLWKDISFSHHVATPTPNPATNSAAAAANKGVFCFHIFSRRMCCGRSELVILDWPIA